MNNDIKICYTSYASPDTEGVYHIWASQDGNGGYQVSWFNPIPNFIRRPQDKIVADIIVAERAARHFLLRAVYGA